LKLLQSQVALVLTSTEIFPEAPVELNDKGEPKKKRKKADAPKPKTASLLSTMTLDTITLDDALKLLSLPRVLGTNSAGEEITVQNGRYGPYLKAGTDSRTLTSEEQLFSINLDEALEIYSKPKERRRGVAKPPLKELGVDPSITKTCHHQRWSLWYVCTDGETNATLRRGDTLEAMTLERGLELLAGRRAAGKQRMAHRPRSRAKRPHESKPGDAAPTLNKEHSQESGCSKKRSGQKGHR
jgi:DNA topoisomerase-1